MERGAPLTVPSHIQGKTAKFWWDPAHQQFLLLQDWSLDTATIQRSTLEGVVDKDPIEILLPSLEKDPPLPLAIKASLDQEILAVLLSETLIRIVPVANKIHANKHWILDYSLHTGTPVAVAPTINAVGTKGGFWNFHGPPPNCKVLPDGILWSNHEGTSQDLIVVTTNALFCYKVSLKRQQLSLTHVLPHEHAVVQFWYEPITRCLTVWQESSSVLQSYALTVTKQHGFPRFELLPPTKFEPVILVDQANALGVVRVYDQAVLLVENQQELELYTLHRSSLKHQLDRILIPSDFSLPADMFYVMDNLLVLCTRDQVLVVDVQDKSAVVIPYSDSDGVDPDMNIPPRHVLKETTIGPRVIPLHVDLKVYCKTIVSIYPADLTRMISFLQRRSTYWTLAQTIILQELNERMNSQCTRGKNEDILSDFPSWFHQILETYPRDFAKVDCQMSVPFITCCALLPDNEEEQVAQDSNLISDSPSQVVTQKMMVTEVLLPQAIQGLSSRDKMRLEFVTDVAVELLCALTKRSIQPCPALYSLLISLLIRTNHQSEALAACEAIAQETAGFDEEMGFQVLAKALLQVESGPQCDSLSSV
jgi:hypothetical protein